MCGTTEVNAAYSFLNQLDDERVVALARAQDRPLELRLLRELPGSRLAAAGLH
jgi:hypothetical protein